MTILKDMTCSKSRSRKKESWSRRKRNQKGRYDEFIWKQESKFADCCTGSPEPEEPEKAGQTESSATTIMAYFKRVRKYGGIMTGITQDVADLEHKGLAERVYEKKEVSFLVSLLKRKLYEVDAKRRFNNKMDYSRYQKIMSICEEYHIEPIPENAYKIAAVTKNQHKNFGITGFQRNAQSKVFRWIFLYISA